MFDSLLVNLILVFLEPFKVKSLKSFKKLYLNIGNLFENKVTILSIIILCELLYIWKNASFIFFWEKLSKKSGGKSLCKIWKTFTFMAKIILYNL